MPDSKPDNVWILDAATTVRLSIVADAKKGKK